MLSSVGSIKKYPFVLSKKEKLPSCDNCKIKAVAYCTSAEKLLCTKCLNKYHNTNEYWRAKRLTKRNQILFNLSTKNFCTTFLPQRRLKNGKSGIRYLCVCKRDSETYKYCFKLGGQINQIIGNKHKTIFHDYLKNGKKPTIKQLKFFEKQGADLEKKNSRRENCFHFYFGNVNRTKNLDLSVIEYLLTKGLDLHQKSRKLQTPFHHYCEKPNATLEMIKFFLDHSFDINELGQRSETILFPICRNEKLNLQIIQFLLEKGINVDHQSGYPHKETALHLLCKMGPSSDCDQETKNKAIKLLLDKSKNVTTQNARQQTAFYLYLTSMNSDLRIIRNFLSKGETLADKSAVDDKNAFHWLFQSTEEITKEKIDLYLENNVDLNKPDIYLFTPFHFLCKNQHFNSFSTSKLEIFQHLKKRNCNFSKKNDNLQTGLFLLCRTGHSLELIEFLLKECNQSAVINQKDINGNTCLSALFIFCTQKMNFDLLKLLFKYGSDPNSVNKLLITPFHLVVNRRITAKYAELFLQNGADVSVKNRHNQDVLQSYIANTTKQNQKILRLLKINFKSIIEDFSNFFTENKFADSGIKGIKFHKLLVKWRTKKKIKFIIKILDQYEKNDILDFMKWIYTGDLPVNFKTENIEHTNLKKIFEEFEIVLDNEQYFFKNSIKSLFLDEKSKDFSLIINETNETIKVHKLILQCRSKLYQNMFDSIEDPNIIQVTDYSKRSKESLQIFIEYLYTGKIDSKKLTRKIKSQLSDAANYYQLNPNCSFDYYIGK
ncbi:ankyrin repeat-containing protein [Anaeramoeba flamelloides]|uniref:Ankyrin repeat-containing protein n=1 Tax=Anaeramoeba flamelloides TaxID=1746091 RepID=A0AAV7YEX2_9EUKA|nr:ankyrin repeat-containing protein [Anaeramoeba flamelloides]